MVLFSTWYQYHAGSQYVEGTTAWIVWQHGFAMAWVALMPFGVALLAHNLNSPNRIFFGFTGLFGLILVITSLFSSWVALAGYVAYVTSNVSPVGTLNRAKPMLEKMVKNY